MRLDHDECRRRFAAADHAVLAVNGVAEEPPLLVPITFVVLPHHDVTDSDAIAFAIDHKPKSTTRLRRLQLIEANPAVAVLVEHYDQDWERLWWVRADGRATILGADDATVAPLWTRSVAALVDAYPQYRAQPPGGDVVAITVTGWSGWSGQR